MERSRSASPHDAKATERRERVLEAAFAAITERGIADTRVADIATRSDMSAGHVMYYFGSKARILAELLRWNEDRFRTELARELETVTSARERLHHIIRASVPSGAGDPHWLLWLEVWARAPRDRELSEDQELEESRFQELLSVVIRDGQASGEFTAAVDATRAATRLSALIDGLAIRVAIGAPHVDPRSMFELVVDEAAGLLGPGAL
jgi:AcrR family transcriptional regulator